MFHVKESFLEWANLTFDKSEFYAFADTGIDQHPTINMHGSYALKHLHEFCNDNTLKHIDLLHNSIDLSEQSANWQNNEFLRIRGKKVGSVCNWQYKVTNSVGIETFKN
jgi:hypothetical protein